MYFIPITDNTDCVSQIEIMAAKAIFDHKTNLSPSCQLLVDDILLTTSPDEFEYFEDLETADKLLSASYEYETRLNRSLESLVAQNNRKTNVNYNYKNIVEIVKMGKSDESNKKSEKEKLPDVSQIKVQNKISFFMFKSIFQDILEVDLDKLTIGQNKFQHPFTHITDFNISISKIAHVALAMKKLLNYAQEYEIYPSPFQTIMIYKDEEYKLTIKVDQQQNIGEIMNFQTSIGLFFHFCYKLIQNSEERYQKQSPIHNYEEINIVPLISNSKAEEEWKQKSRNILNVIKYFIQIIQENNNFN